MKKILAIIFVVVLLTSCTGGINYRMEVKKGDIRKTYTNEYVMTEVCGGISTFGDPIWERVSIEKIDSLSLIVRNNCDKDII